MARTSIDDILMIALRSLLAAMLLGLVPMVQAATLEVSWQDIATSHEEGQVEQSFSLVIIGDQEADAGY